MLPENKAKLAFTRRLTNLPFLVMLRLLSPSSSILETCSCYLVMFCACLSISNTVSLTCMSVFILHLYGIAESVHFDWAIYSKHRCNEVCKLQDL